MDGRFLAPLAPVAVAAVLALPGTAWAPQPPAGASPPRPVVAATPPKPAGRTLSAADLRCLALNVYWEARGQPLSGQAAVAHVTLNRAASAQFPASICGVVYQGCQFGWTCDTNRKGPPEAVAWDEALSVARRAAAGVAPDPTNGALYFHHIHERPQWARGRYGHRVVIGQHVFFNVGDDRDLQVAQTR